jgi:dihydrodipicolinate synthase/N-acetylneuraminate lyase
LQRLTTIFPSSDFAVYAGKSDFFLHGLLSGSAGTIAALANIIPKVHGRLYQLWQEGKTEEAFELQGKLGHADWVIGKIGGINGVKAIVVKNFEYGKPNVRGPLKAVEVENLKGMYYDMLEGLISLEKDL